MSKIKIDIPQKRTKITANLKEDSYRVLSQYQAYISELHKADINFDLILDGLIENLKKDREFKKFRDSKSTETPIPKKDKVRKKIELD